MNKFLCPLSSYRTRFVNGREMTLILNSMSNSQFVRSNISVETGDCLLVFYTLSYNLLQYFEVLKVSFDIG